jgi:prefoldin subunit 5
MQSDRADLSGRQIDTTRWLLNAISMLNRKKPELMSATEMDKELADIKREMEELEMKMQAG